MPGLKLLKGSQKIELINNFWAVALEIHFF